MPTEQERIDAWYENLIQQLARPPYSCHPHLPEDKARLFKMVDPKSDNTEMDTPVSAEESMYDKRNELYQLAAQGKLYFFELASDENCCQIRVEPADKLLHDLRNEVINEAEPPQPTERKLGFFKNILNWLFGAFEGERLQLKEEFGQAQRAYSYHTNGVQCEESNARSMFKTRVSDMRKNQEVARSYAPSVINDLNQKLENEQDLLPWQKNAYEAKLKMFTALRDGTSLTKEECADILAKSIVARMGEYTTKAESVTDKTNNLQLLLHNDPEKAKELEDVIRNSPFVQEQSEHGLIPLVSYTFNPVALDGAKKNAIKSLANSSPEIQKYIENLTLLMDTRVAPQDPSKQEPSKQEPFKQEQPPNPNMSPVAGGV